jgi:Ca2+-binding RTX toxin-like protein
MAIGTVAPNFPVDFNSTFDVGAVRNGDITMATATRIRVAYAIGYEEFTGTDFTFDSVTGRPTGGTITGIRGVIGNTTVYSVTGISLSVVDFLAYAEAEDTDGFLADIFSGNDSLRGSNQHGDYIISYDGDDTISGGAGDDEMEGGLGNDLYIADSFYDFAYENDGGGNDTVQSSSDYLLDPNVETLILTGGAKIFGVGNDLDNLLVGHGGANLLDGDDGNDSIVAGGGNDLLFGWTGDDTIDGGAGNDTILGEEGTDSLRGAAGKDLYVYDPFLGGIDWVNTGDKGIDTVFLQGELYDWDFNRVGNDLYIFALVDEFDSYDETRTIRIIDHYAGAGIAYFEADFGFYNNLFYGGDPDLTRMYTPAGLTGKNQGANAELVVGTDAGEKIVGGGGQTDWLFGMGGDDTITGASKSGESAWLYGDFGNDSLLGGAGNDNLRPGAGDDTVNGGAENPDNDLLFLGDRADFRSSADGVAVDLTKQGAAQFISADQGTDVLTDIENVRGSEFNDTITGDSGANWLSGKAGDDSLVGNEGDDVFDGWGGKDTLVGGAGEDELFGGDGDDSIQGGDGFDFIEGWEGNDTLDGGAIEGEGEDQVTYEFSEARVIVNLSDKDQVVGAETVAGGTAVDGLGGIDTLINIVGVLGSNFDDALFGNDEFNYFEGGQGNDTMIGGAGSDGLDFFGASSGVAVDLTQQDKIQNFGAFLGNDSISGFEEAYGSFYDDILTGNEVDNFLIGQSGNDKLTGGLGNDTLRGGRGNDTLDAGGDIDLLDFRRAGEGVTADLNKQGVVQTFSKNEGKDLVSGFEGIRGSDFADKLTGDTGGNELLGLAGNDNLSGKDGNDTVDGGEGADAMAGGTGDDLYIADNAKDKATEGSKAGEDLVQSSVTFVLAANIEDLELTGDGDINGTGNTSANELTGNDGDNVLDGKTGADTMTGGEGDDSYVVDDPLDDVIEDADGGADTVTTNQGKFIDNVENYIFTGKGPVTFDGGAADNKLVGTVQNDSLTGGLGNDTLDGGKGMDTLLGGNENDSYGIDNAKDVIDDNGTGTETVLSSIAFTLAPDFENLTLTGKAGIAGTGNDGDNLIVGNSGANSLSGGAGDDTIDGGLGADKLTGGAGSDTYLRHSLAEGKDTVTDFETGAGGDVLDISDMLVGFTAGNEADFVQLVTSKTGTTIKVDVDGDANGTKFVDVAVLTAVPATDVQTLVAEGNLVMST